MDRSLCDYPVSGHSDYAQTPYFFQQSDASGSAPLEQATVPVPTQEYYGEAEVPALAYTNGISVESLGFEASEVQGSGYEMCVQGNTGNHWRRYAETAQHTHGVSNSLSDLSDRMHSDTQGIKAVLPSSSSAPLFDTRATEDNTAQMLRQMTQNLSSMENLLQRAQGNSDNSVQLEVLQTKFTHIEVAVEKLTKRIMALEAGRDEESKVMRQVVTYFLAQEAASEDSFLLGAGNQLTPN